MFAFVDGLLCDLQLWIIRFLTARNLSIPAPMWLYPPSPFLDLTWKLPLHSFQA